MDRIFHYGIQNSQPEDTLIPLTLYIVVTTSIFFHCTKLSSRMQIMKPLKGTLDLIQNSFKVWSIILRLHLDPCHRQQFAAGQRGGRHRQDSGRHGGGLHEAHDDVPGSVKLQHAGVLNKCLKDLLPCYITPETTLPQGTSLCSFQHTSDLMMDLSKSYTPIQSKGSPAFRLRPHIQH